MNKKMIFTMAVVLPLFGASISNAAIVFSGSLDGSNEVDGWRTAATAKTLDLDGNNVYGTDGYILFDTRDNNGAFNDPLTAGNGVASTPSYTADVVYSAVLTGGQFAYSSSFNGAEDIDNPAGAGVVNLGYAGIRDNSTNAIPVQSLFTYTMNRNMGVGEVIRMGVMADSLNDNNVVGVAGGLEVTAAATTVAATLVGVDDGNTDMYFFDLTGLNNGDQIVISGGYTNVGGSIAAATIGGVTFDSIPEPASIALFGFGGLMVMCRRTKITAA